MISLLPNDHNIFKIVPKPFKHLWNKNERRLNSGIVFFLFIWGIEYAFECNLIFVYEMMNLYSKEDKHTKKIPTKSDFYMILHESIFTNNKKKKKKKKKKITDTFYTKKSVHLNAPRTELAREMYLTLIKALWALYSLQR